MVVIPEIPRGKRREGKRLKGAVRWAEDDGVVGRGVAEQAGEEAGLADEEVGLGEAARGEGKPGGAARRVRVATPPLPRLDGFVGALGVVLEAAGAFGAFFVAFLFLSMVSVGCATLVGREGVVWQACPALDEPFLC